MAVPTIRPAIEMRTTVLINSTSDVISAVAVAGSARTTQLPMVSDAIPMAMVATSTTT